MCSINGFNFKEETLIRKMVGVTRHRGPDDKGFWCDENVSLGHARLSIIDLSEKGRQPIWNEDKSICVICNGEIYNFKELRKKLRDKGHIFFSNSDSEVILHLFEDKKERCVEYLNGIFAFAIYDKNKNEIFLTRDKIGVKPLYYYYDGDKFIFSSEVKGILTHPVKREIDRDGFFYFFKMFFVPAPFTLIKGIRKLPPAHFLILKNKEITIKKYWDIEEKSEIKSKEEAIQGIKFLMEDSVKRELISDRPVGIFLSGGIDSSSVLGMASNYIPGKVKTFSVGFNIDVEEEKYNRDFWLARKTAQYYNTDHHELLVSDKDAQDNLEKIIWHLEEPIPNPTVVPMFLLAKEAKKEVAVVLGGDGGDEIFGGYPRYYLSKLLDYYQKIPFFFRKNIISPALEKIFKKENLKEKLETPPGILRYLLHMSQKMNILKHILKEDFKEEGVVNFFKKRYPEEKFKDKIKYLMYLDLMTWLPDESLIRTDKMTMAFGLEQRVPILDYRLVEFAFRIPTRYKVRGRKNNKWIFRQAMKEYLPSHLLNKEKRGWFSPGAKWLRRGLKDFAYDVLSPHYIQDTKEYFNFSEIKKILDNHISGKKYNSDIIWSLLNFQIWHKTFINY